MSKELLLARLASSSFRALSHDEQRLLLWLQLYTQQQHLNLSPAPPRCDAVQGRGTAQRFARQVPLRQPVRARPQAPTEAYVASEPSAGWRMRGAVALTTKVRHEGKERQFLRYSLIFIITVAQRPLVALSAIVIAVGRCSHFPSLPTHHPSIWD